MSITTSARFAGIYTPVTAPGGGGITRVGAGSQVAEGVLNGATSGNVAFPGNVTSGNMLIVGGSFFAGGAVSVADTRGTSYTVYHAPGTGAANAWVAWGVAPSGGANTVTATNGSANYGYFSIDEYSGVTQLDVAGSPATDTSATATAPLTTVATDALIIAAMMHSTSTSITPEGTWTEIGEEESNGTIWPYSFITKIVNSAGLHTPEWALGSSTAWQAISVSLKA
jgi:hypothetical protein